uniref:Docking protein 2 n=1 Tax=Amphiprion percula TaxID=161767 RepID=A0A3P8UBC6_AMPPE
MEEDIRKQGMLYLQQQRFGKKWKRVWCVLYRESSCSISRLEFFECKDGGNVEKNDKSLRKQQEHKKVIRLSDCIRVSEVEMDGCPRDTGPFLVETTDKIYVFAADRNQLDEWTHKLCEIAFPMSWMDPGVKRGSLQRAARVEEDEGMEDNFLYSGRDTGRDFRVSVRRTEASDRCRLKGDGILRADGDALHLLDRTGDFLYTWPYRYLRRFGRDKSTFSFEAGRRCDSGEGSFEFDTKQGNLLFQAVEAAINLQKVSAPLRQTSGGGQAADGVYSMVSEPPTLHMSRLEPPVDKALTGVKSLTLDPRGSSAPRKNQVKMISSCPLPHESGPAPSQDQTYSQLTLSAERQSRSVAKRSGSVAPPITPPLASKEPEYSLPFDTIASAVMADLLDPRTHGGRESGADPLYDSIDEMKIRNVFEGVKVEHIYDEPEGCAATTGPVPTGSVYDDPEEMRGNAWRIMGTPVDPKGHEYPYNPRVDDYAVPKRPHRALPAEQREELQDSPYTNVMVKM